MTKLSDIGVPGIGSGVLHPAMAHRFAVNLNSSELIKQQVISASINMLASEIAVRIQQPAGFAQEMLDEISALCSRSLFPFVFKFPFSIDMLDGCGTAYSSVSGVAHVLKHEYVLDYANSEPAVHILVLQYTRAAQ